MASGDDFYGGFTIVFLFVFSDVIDWILDSLIDQTKSRRAVIKKLKELGLIFKCPTKKSNSEGARKKIPMEFTEEEDDVLKEVWPQFAECAGISNLTLQELSSIFFCNYSQCLLFYMSYSLFDTNQAFLSIYRYIVVLKHYHIHPIRRHA